MSERRVHNLRSSAKAGEGNFAKAEWSCRVALAAAYRLLDHFGVRDLTYNHLSARVPGEADAILIKPTDHMFGEVTASSLCKYDLNGQPRDGSNRPLSGGALVLHAQFAKLRPEVNAIFHTHTPANMAIAAQARGLLPITQQALLFYERLAYHDFDGFEFEPGMEHKLHANLGTHQVAVLRNHGLLIAAESIPEAFVLHHFFEIAAQAQIGALSGNADLLIPDAEISRAAAQTMEALQATKGGGKNWDACLRLADRLFPEYAT
ncbi:MAG: class II aldolase/adducin family protein [Xanthobacteraceae bacterium]|nr:class II aldolase/adducin family protein [Xanthobacteraceae bacterium]